MANQGLSDSKDLRAQDLLEKIRRFETLASFNQNASMKAIKALLLDHALRNLTLTGDIRNLNELLTYTRQKRMLMIIDHEVVVAVARA